MTLVEVLAGLVLLGTLLTTMLVTRGHGLRQSAEAQRRIAAVNAADSLLSQWWADPEHLPRNSEGSIDEHTLMVWRTQDIDNTPIEQLGGEVVRLEIVDQRPDHAEQLLASVDIVIPAASEFSETPGKNQAQDHE